jgi:hypothetical protein
MECPAGDDRRGRSLRHPRRAILAGGLVGIGGGVLPAVGGPPAAARSSLASDGPG